MKKPLLARLDRLRRQVSQDQISQAKLDKWTQECEALIQPVPCERSEYFEVLGKNGSGSGVVGPRWLFHLLGLPHRSTHVILTTPTGLILLQKRAATKADHPNTWDVSASGHIPHTEPKLSFSTGALMEIGEELFEGLDCTQVRGLLRTELIPVGAPRFQYEEELHRLPPFYNAEWCQLFTATLTEPALRYLAPSRAEVSGVLMCPVAEVERMFNEEIVAPAFRFSLPRFLAWWQERGNGAPFDVQ